MRPPGGNGHRASCHVAWKLLLCLWIIGVAVASPLARTNTAPETGSAQAAGFRDASHPWENIWCQLALNGLLAAAVGFAVYRCQAEHFRKRAHQLENLVSARTIELAIANADLERLSITDPLTGLKNRRFVEFSIADDLARVRRSNQFPQGEWRSAGEENTGIGFLLIDIDHFKKVNDQYGHPAGDAVLRQLGTLFNSIIRESDTAVRWGGEEFLIIARSPRGNDPATLAERIRMQVEILPFSIDTGQTLHLSCSIGFASWPFFRCAPDCVGWQEVISLADRCLYLAKNGGRNSWIGVSSRPDYAAPAHPRLLNDLYAAEAKGVVQLHASNHTDSLQQRNLPTSPTVHVM